MSNAIEVRQTKRGTVLVLSDADIDSAMTKLPRNAWGGIEHGAKLTYSVAGRLYVVRDLGREFDVKGTTYRYGYVL